MSDSLIDKIPKIELDISDPDFAEKLTAAIGLKPGSGVNFHTPQFFRGDGSPVLWFPRNAADIERLRLCDRGTLMQLRMAPWEKNHWLFPGEWYDHIPKGFPVKAICGETAPFSKETHDDDIRFGCLAYGIEVGGNNE